jgi:tRNA A-37 threonylcarbamoyl transferase component Bud32
MESLEVSMREELSEHPEEKDNLSKIGVDLIRRLHGIGITHGDLHTGNFMRDANGKWMFIDFGRASKSTQNDLQNSLIQFGMSIT